VEVGKANDHYFREDRMSNLEREQYAFESALSYALVYGAAFVVVVVLLTYSLEWKINFAIVVPAGVLVVLWGLWRGIKADRAKSKRTQ
jgi:membrane protein implicated in regulation of membrane protease activity